MRWLWLMLILWSAPLASAKSRPPNILFILADDLGYGDLGSFGQRRIRTPNLDRLANEGMRLTRHYSGNAVCAPSRCVLLTGHHPGHAWIRDNREVQPEGQEPLPADTITLARLLQGHGYATGAFGKWGLGSPGSTGDPLNQGFDRFFGYNCQRVAHNYYPPHLWDNDRWLLLLNPIFSPHQRFPAGLDPHNPAHYVRYSGKEYAPDLIQEQALRFIRDHRDQPFFCFVPSTIPHLALQVPEDSLAEYEGQFPDLPYLGTASYLPHRTPRAAYAAMVTRLDRDVGRLMKLLQDLGLREHTLVVFTSDNGPLWDRFGGTDTEFFNSAGGLRGRKGSLYEGGVRVPCVVSWPGHIPAGTQSDRVTGFEDWLPTLLELAGLKSALPPEVDGRSFAPTLRGRSQRERAFLYREFPAYGGQQSVISGRWKLIRQNLQRTNTPAIVNELYDLQADPTESRNVATEHPQVVTHLEAFLQREHTPSQRFPFPILDSVSIRHHPEQPTR